AIVDVLQGLCHRLVDVLFGTEAVAVFLEREFVFGHQHLTRCLLEPPVHYGGNPQQPGLSVTFGYAPHSLARSSRFVLPLIGFGTYVWFRMEVAILSLLLSR